jgi:hypothetical protein
MPNNPTNKITSEELEKFDKGKRTTLKAGILENGIPNSQENYQSARQAYQDLINTKKDHWPGEEIKRHKRVKELERLLKEICMPYLNEWGAKILSDAEIDISANSEIKPFSDQQENYFRLNGDYWEIGYKGKETRLRNLERLRYIVHLIDNAGRAIYSHDLVQLVKGERPEVNNGYAKMGEERLEAEKGLSLEDIYIPGITEEERDRLDSQLHEVWDRYQLSIGSPNETEHKKKWDAAKRHLLNEYGIAIHESKKGFKVHQKARLNRDAEKSRINVSQQISNAIRDIENKLPDLGRHLRKQIDRGTKCIYDADADDPIKWDVCM